MQREGKESKAPKAHCRQATKHPGGIPVHKRGVGHGRGGAGPSPSLSLTDPVSQGAGVRGPRLHYRLLTLCPGAYRCSSAHTSLRRRVQLNW
jgi:hypothetical protein